ncbi:unnamed protein product [Gongylonema pulchrum]|uniref:CULLIN_2 domain-containing protein n=1 Tax=Gongylonema pulchrum TaxID=637853 RepID=A0A183DPY1_9BILA|nr:unnamed protein product [Gongylonema pulchrum]
MFILGAGPAEKNTTTASRTTSFIVPAVLLPSIQHFEKYYQASHNGRKLTWLYNLANAEVKLNYLDKAYQVTMSVHQLAILLCFENENSLKMDYLEKATGLSGELLFRNIRALADSNILSTADKNAINEGTEVALNLQLSSKRLRFRVNTPQLNRHTSSNIA